MEIKIIDKGNTEHKVGICIWDQYKMKNKEQLYNFLKKCESEEIYKLILSLDNLQGIDFGQVSNQGEIIIAKELNNSDFKGIVILIGGLYNYLSESAKEFIYENKSKKIFFASDLDDALEYLEK